MSAPEIEGNPDKRVPCCFVALQSRQVLEGWVVLLPEEPPMVACVEHIQNRKPKISQVLFIIRLHDRLVSNFHHHPLKSLSQGSHIPAPEGVFGQRSKWHVDVPALSTVTSRDIFRADI